MSVQYIMAGTKCAWNRKSMQARLDQSTARLTRNPWVEKRTSMNMDLASNIPEHRRRVPGTGQAHKGRVRSIGIETRPYQHADCRLVLARHLNTQNGAARSSPSRSTVTLNVLTASRNHYTVQKNAKSL